MGRGGCGASRPQRRGRSGGVDLRLQSRGPRADRSTVKANGAPLNALEDVICWRPDWMADALCHEYHGVDFFPGAGKSPAPALAVCRACRVTSECLAHALEHRIGDGVWGGTSEAQRK